MNRIHPGWALGTVLAFFASGHGAATANARPAFVGACVGVVSSGRGIADTTGALRRFVAWTPGPLERCDYFFVTEGSVSLEAMKTRDGVDRLIISNRFGLMKNLGPRNSVGVTIGLYLAMDEIKTAPSVHYRRWLDGQQSLEVSLGNFAGDRAGLVGPILNVEYSPRPAVFVQAGVCRLRDQWYSIDPTSHVLYSFDRTRYSPYGGLGLSGRPGAGMWSLEALGLIGLIVLVFSGVGA